MALFRDSRDIYRTVEAPLLGAQARILWGISSASGCPSRPKRSRLRNEGGMRETALQLGGDDRIRTGDKGFADPRLNHLATSPSGAGDGIRTRDLLLGKEMLYP